MAVVITVGEAHLVAEVHLVVVAATTDTMGKEVVGFKEVVVFKRAEASNYNQVEDKWANPSANYQHDGRSIAERKADSTCHYCGQNGHWQRECELRLADLQARHVQRMIGGTTTPNNTGNNQQPSATAPAGNA